jgi:hypothetical protein
VVVRRATQAAAQIQKKLHQAVLEEGVELSVKIGIGFGQVSILHVGGVSERMEYIAVGDPLLQVCVCVCVCLCVYMRVCVCVWSVRLVHARRNSPMEVHITRSQCLPCP